MTVANGTVQETKQNPVKNPVQSTIQDTKQLSQTGNEAHSRLALAGLALLGLTAGLFGFGKKKHQD